MRSPTRTCARRQAARVYRDAGAADRGVGGAPVTHDPLAALHEQLVDMRLSLVERLAERMDGGQLALLGSFGGALAAVEAVLRDDGEPPAGEYARVPPLPSRLVPAAEMRRAEAGA
jgi:hypothetical protein